MKMESLLSRKLLGAGLDGLSARFRSAEPFPHLVLDDFLSEEFCSELVAEFPPFDPRWALNEFGQPGRKSVCPELRKAGPAFEKFDDLIQSEQFLGTLSRLTGIADLRYDPFYFGGGLHENLDGEGLNCHVDFNYHPTSGLHRRVNLLLYLNPEWQQVWGGCLELHSDPWSPQEDRITFLSPLVNRCVVFETSERSWHGFERIALPPERKGLSRKSIAIYFYTVERPAEQTRPPHRTIYAPRPLPRHLEAGHRLSLEDVQTIRQLIQGRDQSLRYLYDYVSELSGELEVQRAYRRAHLPISGPVDQIGPVVGLFEDGWTGSSLRLAVRIGKRIRGLVLEGYTPESLRGELELEIKLGGLAPIPVRVARGLFTVRLPVELPPSDSLEVEMNCPYLFNPARDAGEPDKRDLGFHVRKIRFTDERAKEVGEAPWWSRLARALARQNY